MKSAYYHEHRLSTTMNVLGLLLTVDRGKPEF
jgi:hypothetical protein